MNLLVTGGYGFIGSHFIRTSNIFRDLKSVVNIDACTYAADPDRISPKRYPWLKGVVTYQRCVSDVGLVEHLLKRFEITHVIHFAADTHVDNSIKTPEEFVRNNVQGTLSVLDAIRSVDSTRSIRFVYVSTDEVFGSLKPGQFFTKDSHYAPNSPYAASKASGEMLVRAYRETYGLNAVVTNCTNNYGPDQHEEKFIPKVARCALEGKDIPIYGDGSQERDWIHVNDHCEYLRRVLVAEDRSKFRYMISTGKVLSNLHLASVICHTVDEFRPTAGRNSESLIRFVADRPGHDVRYAIDPNETKRDLGEFTSVPFKNGIVGVVLAAMESI